MSKINCDESRTANPQGPLERRSRDLRSFPGVESVHLGGDLGNEEANAYEAAQVVDIMTGLSWEDPVSSGEPTRMDRAVAVSRKTSGQVDSEEVVDG